VDTLSGAAVSIGYSYRPEYVCSDDDEEDEDKDEYKDKEVAGTPVQT
jgi:hypothetical protein